MVRLSVFIRKLLFQLSARLSTLKRFLVVQREGGRVPRTVEVELMEDLVDSCVPGDEVTVTGIVKVTLYSLQIPQSILLFKNPNRILNIELLHSVKNLLEICKIPSIGYFKC